MRALGITSASQGPQGVGWAVGISLAIHGAALAAILWGWGTSSLPEGVQVMDVELVIAAPGDAGDGGGKTTAEPAPASVPSATDSPAPAESSRTPAPEEPPAAEIAAPRDSSPSDVPIHLPAPDAPPPVRTEDLLVQPKPATTASVPASPPRPAASPQPRSAVPAPPPRSAAPARPDKAPASQPGSGATDESAAGSAAAGGGARLVRHVAPVYPALARDGGIEGRVMVRLVIGADGVPVEVRVAQSSGFDSLDAAAVEAVRQWRFEPARRGGVAVAEERLAPVVFRLRR